MATSNMIGAVTTVPIRAIRKEYPRCSITLRGCGPRSAVNTSCDGRSSCVHTRPNAVS